MPIALEITLIVVLVAVAIALVPLLIQLLKTAQGLELFLVSVKKDISQITEDVHASRLRIDHLADTLQVSLAEFASFSKAIGDLGCALKDFHVRFRSSLESASRNIGGIFGGISAVLAFLKSNQSPPVPEPEHSHE